MDPLFSIITVTYNAERTLPATLQSVAGQTCRLFEHIVMDGASTDGTAGIVRAAGYPQLRLFSEPDRGLYDAMNKAMGKARGDYLIFLNAGDRFHSPDVLQAMADIIMDNDYPGIVYGQTDIVDMAGVRLGERHLRAPEKLSLESFAQGMVVCHQAMAVLRRIAPVYNLRYRFSADYEWCIVCLQHSRRNVYMPRVVADYLSEGVTTANRWTSLAERFRIMCTYYGTMSTVLRHFGFLRRYFVWRKKMLKNT